MSLLRSVLKKSAPPSPNGAFDPGRSKSKPSKSSAASFKSVADTIKSISSFYSVVTGNGPKIPKRRRPPLLQFGAPVFSFSDPPPAQLPEGVEHVPIPQARGTGTPFISGHADSLLENGKDGDPWLSVAVFSHARTVDSQAVYHDQATVTGQVRMKLTKPRTIDTIDVWLVGKMDCVLEINGDPIVQQRARVWPPASDPAPAMKKKFTPGTYVFPFTFTPLAQELTIHQPEEAQRNKGKGTVRVDLPTSYSMSAVAGFAGEISYTVGANVVYSNLWDVDDNVDLKIGYMPRTRPLPREIPPFPLLPTREDWPLDREIIGGWMLLPFGGRGRFKDEMIEMEGILGVPFPPVFHARSEVPFKLILWSPSKEALAAFTARSQLNIDPNQAQPEVIKLTSAEAYRLGVSNTAQVAGQQSSVASKGAIAVSFVQNDVHGPDALAPRTASRRNRKSYVRGMGWIDVERDDGSYEHAHERKVLVPRAKAAASPAKSKPKKEKKKTPAKNAAASRRLVSITESDEEESEEEELSSSSITVPSEALDSPTIPLPNALSSPSSSEPPSSPSVAFDVPPSVGEPEHSTSTVSPIDTDTSLEERIGAVELTSPTSPTSSDSGTAVDPDPADELDDDADEDLDEGYFPGMEDAENIVTLSGAAPLSSAAGYPSFNYKYMSRHYMLQILITHPDYNHITPSAKGIYAEAPIWVTSDPAAASTVVTADQALSSSDSPAAPPSTNAAARPPSPPVVAALETAHLEERYIAGTVLPIVGPVVPLPVPPTPADGTETVGAVESVVFLSPATGVHSDKPRPTWKAQRLAAF